MTKAPHASRHLASITAYRNDGAILHPVLVMDRDTGRLCYRGSRGGTAGNRKDQTVFVDNEDQVRALLRAGYSFRFASHKPGSDCNLYSINSRAILRIDGLTP